MSPNDSAGFGGSQSILLIIIWEINSKSPRPLAPGCLLCNGRLAVHHCGSNRGPQGPSYSPGAGLHDFAWPLNGLPHDSFPGWGSKSPDAVPPSCYIQSELPRALIKLFPADAQQLSLLKMLWKRKVGSRKPSFPLFVISRLVRWKQNSPLRRRGAGRSRLRSDPERMEESNGAALSEALLQKLQLKMVNNVLWIKYF